jgi:hypothetical protein
MNGNFWKRLLPGSFPSKKLAGRSLDALHRLTGRHLLGLGGALTVRFCSPSIRFWTFSWAPAPSAEVFHQDRSGRQLGHPMPVALVDVLAANLSLALAHLSEGCPQRTNLRRPSEGNN